MCRRGAAKGTHIVSINGDGTGDPNPAARGVRAHIAPSFDDTVYVFARVQAVYACWRFQMEKLKPQVPSCVLAST